MELELIKIYRITHIKNIPHILQYGVTHKNSENLNPNFITIGDISLIETRNNKLISIDNGTLYNANNVSITLGSLIPFYFGKKMPMLYVTQNGGNFVKNATSAEDIVYLSCPLIDIINTEINYYFSDGHATDNMTSFYDRSMIEQLPSIIDWISIKAPYWGGQDNLGIKRKKQAEFLIESDLPPIFIDGFGCFNGKSKNELLSYGIENNRITEIPYAYY